MQPARATTTRRDADEDVVHKGKDLRIPNTTPEQLAKALMSGGAKPRPETRLRKESQPV